MRLPYWSWGLIVLLVLLFILILTHSIHLGVSAEIWPNAPQADIWPNVLHA